MKGWELLGQMVGANVWREGGVSWVSTPERGAFLLFQGAVLRGCTPSVGAFGNPELLSAYLFTALTTCFLYLLRLFTP